MNRLLPPIEWVRESDGTTLLALSRRDVPLVFTRICCPGGEALPVAQKPGLVDLTEELLEEGPAGISPLDWRRRLDQDALHFEAGFMEHHAWADAGALSEDLDHSLSLFSAWLSHPGLPKSEWQRLVKALRVEMCEAWAQPSQVIGQLSQRQNLGPDHPNARFAHERNVKRVRYDEARSLGQCVFHRKGAFGLIGGDLTIADGHKRLRQLISALPETHGQAGVITPEPAAKPSSELIWVMDHKKIDQAFFALARPGIRAGDAERVALRLANYALGAGGFNARLMKRVREAMGHTYSISSSLPEWQTLTPFTIQSFTQIDKLSSMLQLIQRVVQEIASSGFSEEEVDDARQYAFGSLPLKLTSPSSVLCYVLNGLVADLSPETLEADWLRIQETSRNEVNEAARRLIGDGAFRLALIGPAKKILPQLPRQAPTAVFAFKTPPDRWPDC